MINLKQDYIKTDYDYIYKHKTNNTYAVVLPLYDKIYNKRILKRKINLKTISEAQDFITDVRYMFKQQDKQPQKDILLKEAYKIYIEHCELEFKKENLAESTVDGKKIIFKNQILPKLGNVKLIEISDEHIKKFHKDLLSMPNLHNKSKNLSNQTLMKIHKQLSAFLNFCAEKKLISYNPARVVKNFGKVKVEKEYLTHQEFDKLLSVVDNIRDYLILELMFYTGVRVGELLGLTKDSIVTTENGTSLNINKTYYKEKIRNNAKTSESMDDLFLDDITVSVYNEYIEYRKANNIDNNFLFANNRGKCEVLGDRAVRDMLKKYLKLAGIDKNITPHKLRHSHAAFLISRGYQLEDIKARLRHKDIRTTSNEYGHMYKERKISLAKEITSFRTQNNEKSENCNTYCNTQQ